jgi:hypothetical protein
MSNVAKNDWPVQAHRLVAERWGGGLYWHAGSHAGHPFSRRVQEASERFLRSVTEQAPNRSPE